MEKESTPRVTGELEAQKDGAFGPGCRVDSDAVSPEAAVSSCSMVSPEAAREDEGYRGMERLTEPGFQAGDKEGKWRLRAEDWRRAE